MVTKGASCRGLRVRGCGSGTCSGAVGGEADGDFGDLVGVDADGVLEAAFVVVDDVVELVVRVAFERDCGGDGAVFDAVFGDLVADGRRERIWNGSRWTWMGACRW